MRRLLRTARHVGSVRDRALLALLCGTGLRLAEAAALDVADVPTTESTGAVHVRAGKELPDPLRVGDAGAGGDPAGGQPAGERLGHGGRRRCGVGGA